MGHKKLAVRKTILTPKRATNVLTHTELKGWRARMGMTQRQAAIWLDVPLKAYQKWEQDYRQAHNPGPIKARMAQARPRKREK